MTDLLKDVLHEHADSVSGPHVDLDAIVRTGDRRLRRARVTTGLAAAAVVALVAGAAVTVPHVLDTSEPPPAAPSSPFDRREVGYAVGDVIHWGDRTFPVGDRVVSYVQTDDGFVYTSPDQDVMFFDGTDSQRIGHTGTGSLRTDDSGSLVAWVDGGRADAQYVVYDTHSLTEKARVDATGVSVDDGGPVVYAVDDGSAYWRTPDGITRYDVGTGSSDLLSGISSSMENPQRLPGGITDVAAGRIAYSVRDLNGEQLFVGTAIGDGAKALTDGFTADLSPDGAYAITMVADQLGIHDTATGETVAPAQSPDAYRHGVGWLDADTAFIVEFPDVVGDPGHAELQECDVPSGGCRSVVALDFPSDNPESFVAPTGEPTT